MTTLSVISELEEFGQTAKDWDAALIQNDVQDCSLSSHWIINFLKAFKIGDCARILCARDAEGMIIGQAAFYLSRKGGVSVLNSLTNEYASRSSISFSGTADVIIRDWIRKQRVGFIRAGRFPPSPLIHGLFPNPRVSRSYQLPVISTESSYEDFLANRSGNFRKSLKRAKAKHGGLRVEVIDRPQDRINDMLKVSRKTWKFEAGTAIASDDAVQAFYTGLAVPNEQDGGSQPMLFMIYDQDDEPVAFLLGLIFNRVLFALKMGYDPQISDCFPGFALLNIVTEFSFDRSDISLIDLDAIGAHGDYKSRWATEMRELTNIIGFPNSPLGLLSRGAWAAKEFLGRKSETSPKFEKGRTDEWSNGRSRSIVRTG